MTRRPNKRKGGSIGELEPSSKRSNKENTLNPISDGSQRRSSRDRTSQKTPLQQLEEISSVVSGLGQPNGKSTRTSILEDAAANPMAPDASRMRRNRPAARHENSSLDPSVLRPTTLTVPTPTLDMQHFAAMVTGNAALPDSEFSYNLILPSDQPSELTQMSTPDASSQMHQGYSGQLPPTITQSADGGATINGAVFTYDPTVDFRSSQAYGNLSNDAEAYSSANVSTPDVVYDWLHGRQGFGAPLNGHSGISEGVNSQDMSAAASQEAFYGGLDWANKDSYLSNGDDQKDGDDELSETSDEEESAVGSGNLTYFGNGLATSTGTAMNFSGNASGYSQNPLQHGSVTTSSSLENALGPTGGTSNNSAQSAPVMVSDTPRAVPKRFPPVAVPHKGHLVLEAHHKRNGRPRPPTAESLALAGSSSNGTSSRPILRPAATDSAISRNSRNQVIDQVTRPVPIVSHGAGSGRSSQSAVNAAKGNHGTSQAVGTSRETTGQSSAAVHGKRAASVEDASDSDDGESEIDVEPRVRAPRYSKTPRASKTLEPDKAEFYPPNWQTVLKIAKMLLRRWIAVQVPFPNRREHYGKMLEFIDRALEIHQQGGGFVEDGYFQEHRNDMQKLLWDEIANFRGTIKLFAREAILGYGFIPEDITDKNVYKATLIANVRAWKRDAFFLQNGVDANGSVNNFAHPIYRQVLMASFYSSLSKLAAQFPDDFYFEPPRQALALVATAMFCAFDEWLSGRRKTLKFSGENYSRVLADMLKLMADLEADPVQAMKLQTLRRVWARMGRHDPQDEPINNGFAVAL